MWIITINYYSLGFKSYKVINIVTSNRKDTKVKSNIGLLQIIIAFFIKRLFGLLFSVLFFTLEIASLPINSRRSKVQTCTKWIFFCVRKILNQRTDVCVDYVIFLLIQKKKINVFFLTKHKIKVLWQISIMTTYNIHPRVDLPPYVVA